MVLDVGCGRGLMLIGAAQRLTTGRAVGVDIWQAQDQANNTASATLANAACAGVADKVMVRTADMRDLPFADESFDVILSHWAVHNIADAAGRDAAIGEMVRVLRPGGSIVLADIVNRHHYAARFTALHLPTPRLIADPVRDAVLKTVSFGSFQPFALVATKAA